MNLKNRLFSQRCMSQTKVLNKKDKKKSQKVVKTSRDGWRCSTFHVEIQKEADKTRNDTRSLPYVITEREYKCLIGDCNNEGVKHPSGERVTEKKR